MRFLWTWLLLLALPGTVQADDAWENEGGRRLERIEALREQIENHDDLYFRQAAPVISDAEYDRLKRELRRLESEEPTVAEASAGVGDDRTGRFDSRSHRVRMGSLAKAHEREELDSFDGRLRRRLGRDALDYVLEPKVDGIAVSVAYEAGELVHAVTRGDGFEGEDITENVRTLTGLPERLKVAEGDSPPAFVELHGEIYFTREDFERLNAERVQSGEEAFAHPRNAAAGTVKLQDPEEVRARGLSVVFFGWGAWEPVDEQPEAQTAFQEWLRERGVPGFREPGLVSGTAAAHAAIPEIQNWAEGLGYPTDGVVIKLNEVALREQVGWTASAPGWAVAWKFPAEPVRTRVLAIKVQVGRTGLLTPVAELEPVGLEGAVVSRAVLHNVDWISERDIREGDYVVIRRAGGVIPEVVEVDLSRRGSEVSEFCFPESCPVCDSPVVVEERSPLRYCPNSACPERVLQGLVHFGSDAGLDIEGLGPRLIQRLLAAGIVQGAADFYAMEFDELSALEGVSEARARGILRSVAASRDAELRYWIQGLGIRGVGPANAQKLEEVFGDLESFVAALKAEAPIGAADTLWSDVPPSVVEALKEYSTEPGRLAMLDKLVTLGAARGRWNPGEGE